MWTMFDRAGEDGNTSGLGPASDGRLWIEVVSVGPPICGVVHRRHGQDVAFAGWLELVGALDAVSAVGGEAF
jgi:hypothetical protein